MSIIEAIIFGIVQGITEFLPISSTAHIIITERLLNLHFEGLAFEIFLHLASVIAVILFFYKDLWRIIHGFFSYFSNQSDQNRVHFYYALYIIIATIITGVLGVILQSYIDEYLKGAWMMSISLMLTGIFLIVIERFHKIGHRKAEDMTFYDAIIIGLAQALAIIPGLSRSGTTLIVGLWVGLDRDTAVRYSFLLSIPVILGSTVLAFGDAGSNVFASIGSASLIVAFIATFIFSIIGIKWLIELLKRGKLAYFAIYCFFVALLVLVFF